MAGRQSVIQSLLSSIHQSLFFPRLAAVFLLVILYLPPAPQIASIFIVHTLLGDAAPEREAASGRGERNRVEG